MNDIQDTEQKFKYKFWTKISCTNASCIGSRDPEIYINVDIYPEESQIKTCHHCNTSYCVKCVAGPPTGIGLDVSQIDEHPVVDNIQ